MFNDFRCNCTSFAVFEYFVFDNSFFRMGGIVLTLLKKCFKILIVLTTIFQISEWKRTKSILLYHICYTHYPRKCSLYSQSIHLCTLPYQGLVLIEGKVCRVILLYTTTLHKPRKRNERRVEKYKTIFGLFYLKSRFFIVTVNRKCRVCRVCRVKRKKFLKKNSNLNF